MVRWLQRVWKKYLFSMYEKLGLEENGAAGARSKPAG